MARPAILTVDDDAPVSAAIARDLRARYGADHRILRASSGAEALELVARLLLTVPFVLAWRAFAGRDVTAAVAGAVVLAFVWATYGDLVGPLGLPDAPLR